MSAIFASASFRPAARSRVPHDPAVTVALQAVRQMAAECGRLCDAHQQLAEAPLGVDLLTMGASLRAAGVDVRAPDEQWEAALATLAREVEDAGQMAEAIALAQRTMQASRPWVDASRRVGHLLARLNHCAAATVDSLQARLPASDPALDEAAHLLETVDHARLRHAMLAAEVGAAARAISEWARALCAERDSGEAFERHCSRMAAPVGHA